MHTDITTLSFDTLLAKPSVTVYMDGLIMVFHDEAALLTRAAIHTKAGGHSLRVAVRNRVTKELKFDRKIKHDQLNFNEPLWLFVGSALDSPPPDSGFEASQQLSGIKSFRKVLDFESTLYPHALENLRTDRFAVLNVPHGIFYSAASEQSELHSFEQDEDEADADFEKDITTCTFGAADIDARSEPGDDKYISMWHMKKSRERLFSFRLEADTHYNIYVLNVPDNPHGTHPEVHFLQYYELFDLRPGEKKYTVKLKKDSPKLIERAPDSPPCNISQGGTTPRPGG